MTFTLPRLEQKTFGKRDAGIGCVWHKHGNLPLERLEFDTTIRGLVCETTVTQCFFNSHDQCIEATYSFPLPEHAAVVQCQMVVGNRVIDAQLQDRSTARENYDRAIVQGHRASIMEEERGEAFTLRVGNIPAGEAIEIRLTLVSELTVVHGEATLRLPLVIAPRYVPGKAVNGTSVGSGVSVDTDQVPDASNVTPPMLLPGCPSPVDLSIDVSLDPGDLVLRDDWWRELKSSLHAVSVDEGRMCRVSLKHHEKIDRDFILRFTIADDRLSSTLSLESNVPSGKSAFAISLMPPRIEKGTASTPRDVLFLLDRSASMDGWKFDTARQALCDMMKRLGPKDRFRVMVFDDHVESLGSRLGWMEATRSNQKQAIKSLKAIDIRGGTELAPAMRDALRSFRAEPSDSALRNPAIVLVTDGQVAGEDIILRTWKQCEPKRQPRVFCLGIDRAVNASVLTKIAQRTGGLFEFVETKERVKETLARFMCDIGSPVLQDIRFEDRANAIDLAAIAPSHRLSLYDARPLTIYGRTFGKVSDLALTIHGTLVDGSQWSQELKCQASEERNVAEAVDTKANGTTQENASHKCSAILSLWGRRRVRQLEDDFASAGARAPNLQHEIVATSLEANVLSRFTAYVAVDRSEVVNTTHSVAKIVQPVERPEGWQGQLSPFDEHAIELIPESVARESNVLPVASDSNGLVVRMSDPNDLETIEKLRFILNRNIIPEAGDAEEIVSQINASYGQVEGESADSMLQEFTDTAIDFTETEDDMDDLGESDAPNIKLVHLLIAEAVQLRASAIFIAPDSEKINVSYVIDGKLVKRDTPPPRRLLAAIASRFKTLAKLSIANRDRMEVGEVSVTVGDRETRLTVFMIPHEVGMHIFAVLDSLALEGAEEAPWLDVAEPHREAEPESYDLLRRLSGAVANPK